MSNESLQEQLIELQTRLVFQEDTIHELNAVIARQDEQLLLIQLQLKLLGKRFDDYLYTQDQEGASPLDEKPPHY
jgi:SlyX protein